MSGKANERELFYGEKLGKMIRCENDFQCLSAGSQQILQIS